CSASNNIDPVYFELAASVVEAACKAGYGIVSGGTVKGCMVTVAATAAAFGVYHRGVLPRFMKGLENPALSEIQWTDTMSERKELMRKDTCLAVALPGGVGTLDELSETFCLAKMNLYPGRVIVFNYKGFFNGFKAQLETFVETGMLGGEELRKISFPETVEEFKELL
ncbi:MAG: LOG family protein, partial [Bacteroidales bacterium]|nr:LOG family protein [Bacteroidales bacterium]